MAVGKWVQQLTALTAACWVWAPAGQMLLLPPQKFLVMGQWASLSLHSCSHSSSDHFEVHKDLTTVEKYRWLLFWTDHLLFLIFFWLFLQHQVVSFIFSFGDLCDTAPLLLPHHIHLHFFCIYNGVASNMQTSCSCWAPHKHGHHPQMILFASSFALSAFNTYSYHDS